MLKNKNKFILWLSFSLMALTACLFSSGDLKAQSANHPYDSKRELPEPVIFGEGVISTTEDELNATFTADGKTIYFSKNSPGNGQGVIVVSSYKNGKWSEPSVASFSGQYSDYDPYFSPDGNKLFYISNRPLSGTKPKRDYDIWFVEKTPDGWGAPQNLGAPINTEADEFYPSVAADNTLYFSTVRQGGKGSFDLYASKLLDGKYTELQNLGDANSRGAEIDSYVAPDQSYIIFASYGRPDSLGGGDLYISYRREGKWSEAKNLGVGINSSAKEYTPIVSPNGKYFFFTSLRGFADNPPAKAYSYRELVNNLRSLRNGMGNIYQVDISALRIEK
jgi:hypothetical protein